MKKFLIFFVSIIFLAGCKSTQSPEDCSTGFHEQEGICVQDFDIEEEEGEFSSSDDILNLFLTFSKRADLLGIGTSRNMMFASMEMDEAAPTNASDKGSDDYSETNNQVEGVDEMDNVLTDGKYIYIQTWDKIQIVLAYTMASGPEVLDLVKEITFEEGDKQFLDYFNLESLQQLPALSEIRDIDGGAKDLGFEAELAAARVLEMPENAEDDASIELSDDEKAEMLAEEEAIALSQKPLDEILHPNGRPDLQGTEDDEEDAEENDDFAEIDEALAALEEDLGGDPSRLGEAIAGERNEGQLSSEESEGGSDDAVPTE